MPKKQSYITLTDQFCGAGGSSQGARQLAEQLGGGLEVKLALNHWKLAIETHQHNFPDTMHDCTDISACDPRRYPSTDILLTSPECTNHSLAKGKKIVRAQMELYDTGALDPAAERSRATMWDVPRFAEYHNYNMIIVENVVDARKWVMFDAWLMAMHSLGYKHKCVYLNSMHCHPTPQSRDRMYVVFWKKGNKAPDLDIKPLAHCTKCDKDVHSVQTWKKSHIQFGKYKQQYIYCCPGCAKQVEPYYYAAFNCIDWSNIGTRIGDRKKALSENTIRRIEYGLKKYGTQPLAVHNFSPGYCSPMNKPTGTVTTSDQHALALPFVVATRYTSGIECRVHPITKEIQTQPGDVSHGIAMPFIIKEEHTQNLQNAIGVNESLRTQTTRQTMALCVPWIINNKGQSNSMKIEDSLPSQTTTTHLAVALHKLIGYYYGQNRRKQQNHICPMPFDEVNRLIEFYSMPGEVVADPFGGIGTTGVCALKKGRKTILTELNDVYAKTAAMYLKETEMKNNLPTLFDVLVEQTAQVA